MKLFKINITIFSMLLLPALSFAQIHERSQMANRMNPENESSKYTLGIFSDTTQYQSLIEYGKNTDEGEESEDAILTATEYKNFETKIIHYLNKFDYSSLTGSMPMKLTDEKNGKYFSCPVEGIVTSHFGPRRTRFHYGTDIGMKTGTPVKSMFDGVVRYAGWCSGYGNIVVVRHDNGLETYYGHLSKINVKANQKAKAGDIVGLVGSTGRSTGPHLHLEIRYLGSAMNPEHFIDFSTFTLKSDDNGVYNVTRSDFKPTYSKGTSSRQLAKSSVKKSNSKNRRSSSAVATHKVKKGETLGAIAKKNGTTVAKLQKLNGIKGTNIKAGQKIKVK
ncbi:MAG: peptidoglycan DD-metalloendopeptidase family protein [Bacteroidales bacterium]|nr:peptidoglycan DD-metalloendopeptidase family protein [Bacteroidales bacterium]MBQ9312086.1 peptidoglycan DD-metalloendopeptidase family protein [Bacteroidales bacterium]